MNVLSKQISRAKDLSQPLFSTLEITQSCNLRCKHCYNFDRSAGANPVQKDLLSFKEIKHILTSLNNLGALSLNITGGEPLTHPDLENIISEAKSFNFHIRLKTNGILLDHNKAKKLFTLGVREVDISLYGADEMTYQKFCKKEGHTKTIEAIRIAKESDLKVNVSIILHKLNFRDLDKMINQVEELGVFYQVSDEITDRYDKTNASNELGLNQSDYTELLQGPYHYFFNHENTEKSLQCGCAKTVIGINAFGDVFPCIGAPIPCGNIRENTLESIWKNSETLINIRNLDFKDFKECVSCPLIESCSRSSGSAFVNTGEYTGCDPVAKVFAKARSNLKKS
ncbi:MAG: radical SAM protein [Bacteriovoracaceae bacterium]|nr:radical SAM protein [Bacteriovoracaceae bacterium]